MAAMKSGDFQHGTVTGCHLSNNSVRQMSALPELPRSTVSAVTVKWKRRGATTAQPRSGRPHKLTERGPPSAEARSVKIIVCLQLHHSLPSSKLPLEATSAQKLFVGSFLKWVSKDEQPLKPKITMCNAKCWLEWCKACRHWTLDHWKCVLSSDESRFTNWQKCFFRYRCGRT